MENVGSFKEEPFPPSFHPNVSPSSGSRMTLGSTLGFPMAASTVAKIRPAAAADNRATCVQASYIEDGQLSHVQPQDKFALSLNEDIDTVDDFIAANRFSDLLVKVNLEDSGSTRVSKSTERTLPPLAVSNNDLSTGQLSYSHISYKDALVSQEEEFSDRESTSSFLANEKLMSLDSMNSDVTDEEVDLNKLHEEELEVYFNRLMPPSIQRGTVEGQELPVELLPSSSPPNSEHRCSFFDDFDQKDFRLPNVRLAATGMDSCPASDEEEDELETSHIPSRSRFLLPNSIRQTDKLGESHLPSFRPVLEGGSSEDESQTRSVCPDTTITAVEQRCSAEGHVLRSPITVDGGGRDHGSSGSVVRGRSIVGGNGDASVENPTMLNRPDLALPGQIFDSVWSVGSGEAVQADPTSRFDSQLAMDSSMTRDRQEYLDAMNSLSDFQVDSVYLREGANPDRQNLSSSHNPLGQGSFTFSQLDQESHSKADNSLDYCQTDQNSPRLRGVPFGNSQVLNSSSIHKHQSVESKDLANGFQKESTDLWNENGEASKLESQQAANTNLSVVYQNEEGKWVTDLAYYSSFEKEMENNTSQLVAVQFQSEDFLAGSQAMDKIILDQEEFEKEHQFMQEEQIEAVNVNEVLGDTSWRLPKSNHILMRASQESSGFEACNQSYLRISLGEFFQRRSEALGWLGSNRVEAVRRPSFGYVITSPEKRDPVALIRPSDVFFTGSSTRAEAYQQSDGDETLNRDDLDETLEPCLAEPQCETVPAQTDKEVSQVSAQHMESSKHCSETLNSTCNSMLSISTIAAAIEDASISLEPSQLAAMIMELSKRNRSKNIEKGAKQSHTSGVPLPIASGVPEELQQNKLAGDLGPSDMEKYLKREEISGSESDSSSSQICMDVLTLSETSTSSEQQTQAQELTEDAEAAHTAQYSVMEQPETGRRHTGNEPKSTEDVLPALKLNIKHTAIPPPEATSLPVATVHLAQRSGQLSLSSSLSPEPKSAHLKSSADKMEHCLTNEATVSTNKMAVSWPADANDSATVTARSLRPDNSTSAPGMASKTSPNTLKCKCTSPTNNSGATKQTESPRRPQRYHLFAKDEVDVQDSLQNPIGSPESIANVEVSRCNFRPSTSPLTHSSPSQASISTKNDDTLTRSPTSPKGRKSPASDPGSPQSCCSSPSLSRLTYVSVNENTCLPTPGYSNKNASMTLSTTIVRASPTPDGSVHNSLKSPQYNSCSGLSDLNQKSSYMASSNQSDVYKDLGTGTDKGIRHSEQGTRLRTCGDSGYSSKINSQHPAGMCQEQLPQQFAQALGPLPCFGARNDLTNSSQGGLSNVRNHMLARPVFTSQVTLPYLGSEGQIHNPVYQTVHAVPSAALRVPGPSDFSLHTCYINTQQHLSAPIPVSNTFGSWTTQHPDFLCKVFVPNELKFPSSCCVGIASQTSLTIFNPSEHWQQVCILVKSLSINGEKVDSLPFQWLTIKNKTIIGPKCTEEQKLLFIAPRAGLYQCTLSVTSWPAAAESEMVTQAEVFAKKVFLTAVAENPSVLVDIGKAGCLDFGDLTGGSVKALPLKLVNQTRATLPIRLVITANSSAWQFFGFSKSPIALATDSSMISAMAPHSTSSVINHLLYPSHEENPETFLVWVYFSAPHEYNTNSGVLGPADEYSARVDVEVDSPGPSHVIQSVSLKARSGIPRVHAPKDSRTVCLRVALGETAQRTLPLKNAGNIDVSLKLKCVDGDGCFSVRPEELTLKTGEEQAIVVSFSAQGTQTHRDSLLMILVLPGGPQYEVMLRGELELPRVKGVSPPPLLARADVPLILSNKQFMAWGGVTLGRAVQQKLVLRNSSSTTSQHLRLLIRGNDQDCFQLQSYFGPEERLTRNRELSIKPKDDVTVHLLFTPSRVTSMLAKLEIKQSAARAAQAGLKFTIPLSGYGGTSNVILEDVRKRSDGYVALLRGVRVGRVSQISVHVRNTGSRAAFVRAVPYSDLQNRAVMDSTVVSVSPSQFVLKERTQEVITIAMKTSLREQTLSQSATALLFTLCLFCGDEVSRQRFKKFLQFDREPGRNILSENSLLKRVPFHEVFLGEEHVEEVCDLPQRPNEAQLFYGNMSKVTLFLYGTTDMSDSGESKPMQSSNRNASDSGLNCLGHNISNVSLDVLPVKGPSLSPSEVVVKKPELEDTWCIEPEQLVLTTPFHNTAANAKHVQILNRSNRTLSFELSWPAHCLTITPQHGVIEPKNHLQIRIRPSPTLTTKSSTLPWSGQIYVNCNDQQKTIKVLVRADLAKDDVSTDSSSHQLPDQTKTLSVPGPDTPGGSNQSPIEIKNRTLVFPPTESGNSSECSLEAENHGKELVWCLSSFAPPYVKGVDGAGDVYRATYPAFSCETQSGTLGFQEVLKVPFTFLPRDRGDYTQFWNLKCHPAAKPHVKSCVKFQLSGSGLSPGETSNGKENGMLVKRETGEKNRKRAESSRSKTGSSSEAQKQGVYAPQRSYTFPATRLGTTSMLKVNFRNNSPKTDEQLNFVSPKEPFHIKHSKYLLRAQHYINLPVQFVPISPGQFCGILLVQTDTDEILTVELRGDALC